MEPDEKSACEEFVSCDTLRPAPDENPVKPTRAYTWVLVILLLLSLAGISWGLNSLLFKH